MRGPGCHLVDEIMVVKARLVRDVDRPSRETSCSGMQAGVAMIGLEHVPVR